MMPGVENHSRRSNTLTGNHMTTLHRLALRCVSKACTPSPLKTGTRQSWIKPAAETAHLTCERFQHPQHAAQSFL